MWKSRREDDRPSTPSPQPTAAPLVSNSSLHHQPATPLETPQMDTYRADVAHIGKSVIIRGELSGSEDLYLDGEVEGNIDLHNHSLVIGPNGKVRADVSSKDVVIHGKVDGKVIAEDRVELKKSAVLNGDISTARIVIEDGAFFKGAIDIRKTDAAKSGANTKPATLATTSSVTPTPPAKPAFASTTSSIENIS